MIFFCLVASIFGAVLVVCCLPCGAPGAGAYLEKQVFEWSVYRISHVGLFRARPKTAETR